MKKFLAFLAAVAATVCLAFSAAACGGDGETIKVFMPDGAPSLSMAKQMSEDMQFGKKVSYNVVDANTITQRVTGENPEADICVLPVTAASKVIGDGSVYKMLGTVTHGNLYILTVSGEDITRENAASLLTGKTVGIVNIAAFPGQMFRLLMSNLSLGVKTLSSEDMSAATDKVNIVGVNGGQVGGASSAYDYYVVPEQAASGRVKVTAQTDNPVKICGSLQELYGADSYPQAVLVAKYSVLEDKAFIASFTAAMSDCAEWITAETTEVGQITSAISAHIPAGADATFNTNNLTKEVITRCSVKYVPASQNKEEVKSFLAAMSAAVVGSASQVTDEFFYL